MDNLTEEQKEILFNKGTEAPFSSKLDSNFLKGKYICVNCKTDLFESEQKFNSGCGWPSFFSAKNVELKPDHSHSMIRTEVICKKCKGHLGHFFEDGPKNSRYCINGAVLNFKKED